MHKIGGIVALGLLAGCTVYQPLPSPRIAEVSGGYTRDGRLYPHGAFGSGLAEVVSGNPQAESQASTFRGLTIAGFVIDLAAVGLAAGAAVEFAGPTTNPDGTDTATQAIGLGLLGGALGAPRDGHHPPGRGRAAQARRYQPLQRRGRTGST